jgi:hypothetical protein
VIRGTTPAIAPMVFDMPPECPRPEGARAIGPAFSLQKTLPKASYLSPYNQTLWSLTLLGYALFVEPAFHLFVVSFEEPALRKAFGTAYEEYRKAAPRWIPTVIRAKRTVRE